MANNSGPRKVLQGLLIWTHVDIIPELKNCCVMSAYKNRWLWKMLSLSVLKCQKTWGTLFHMIMMMKVWNAWSWLIVESPSKWWWNWLTIFVGTEPLRVNVWKIKIKWDTIQNMFPQPWCWIWVVLSIRIYKGTIFMKTLWYLKLLQTVNHLCILLNL